MKRDVELSSPWERGEPSFSEMVEQVRVRTATPRPCSLCAHFTPWTQPSLAHLGECDRDHSTGAGSDTCAGWEAKQ